MNYKKYLFEPSFILLILYNVFLLSYFYPMQYRVPISPRPTTSITTTIPISVSTSSISSSTASTTSASTTTAINGQIVISPSGNFNSIQNEFCSTLMNQRIVPQLKSSYISSILSIAFLISLMVLSVVGLAYAIGIGFNFSKLVQFSKAEYVEQIFNLILIIFVLFLFTSMPSIVSGIAQFIGYATNTQVNSFSSDKALFTALCGESISNLGNSIGLYAELLAIKFLFDIINSLSISLAPYGLNLVSLGGFVLIPLIPGFSFTIFNLSVLITTISFMINTMIWVIGLMLATAFLSIVIYQVFPILFLIGVVFRSFPWTRAAGGAMIAAFISIYFFFPALLYSLILILNKIDLRLTTVIIPTTTASGFHNIIVNMVISLFSYLLPFIGFISIFSSLFSLTIQLLGVFISYFFYFVAEILGLAVAFIISYELLEILGDLLGAPSLSREGLLGRII